MKVCSPNEVEMKKLVSKSHFHQKIVSDLQDRLHFYQETIRIINETTEMSALNNVYAN